MREMKKRSICRKLILLCLCIACCISMMAVAAFAAERNQSNENDGTNASGEDVAVTVLASGTGWTLDSTGTLKLTGAINVQADAIQSPWFDNWESIKKVVAYQGASINEGNYLFNGLMYLASADLKYLDTSKVTSMNSMFGCCFSLQSIDISAWNTSNCTDMRLMFMGCNKLTTVKLGSIDTRKVEDMNSMFWECEKLKTITVGNIDTSSVTDMGYMFQGCRALTKLDLSWMETENVEGMNKMFCDCTSLQSLNISSFDTGSLDTCNSMFENCSALTSLDATKINTSKVYDLSGMFKGCKSLTSLNLSVFDMSYAMFADSMFEGCTSLKSIDLSNSDMSGLWTLESMFKDCSSLTSIGLPDVGDRISGQDQVNRMFFGCNKLAEIKLNTTGVDPYVAGEIYALCPFWINTANSKVYSSAKEISEITGKVTIRPNRTTIIKSLTNSWYGVTVKWTAVAGNAVTLYRKSDEVGSQWTKLTKTTAASYYDKTTKNNTGYTYAAVLDRADKSVKSQVGQAIVFMEPPTIKAITNGSGSVTVSWNAVEGADAYYVYRKDTQAGTWHMIGSTLTKLTYTDSTVENGVVYYYAIKSCTKNGTSSIMYISASSSAKNTLYLKNNFVSALTNPAAGSLKVTVSKNAAATGYEIVYGTTSNLSDGKTVKVTGAATLNKTITGLTKGKTYYVKVRVYKTVKTSTNSYTFYSDWSAVKKLALTK